jgi:hypothetical protein
VKLGVPMCGRCKTGRLSTNTDVGVSLCVDTGCMTPDFATSDRDGTAIGAPQRVVMSDAPRVPQGIPERHTRWAS